MGVILLGWTTEFLSLYLKDLDNFNHAFEQTRTSIHAVLLFLPVLLSSCDYVAFKGGLLGGMCIIGNDRKRDVQCRRYRRGEPFVVGVAR